MTKATPKPTVITMEETHRRPRWEFSKGMNTYMRICTEIEGSRNAIQGWCEHEPDFEPMIWDQANWDELFFCVKGSIKVHVEDRDGSTKDLVAHEHESMFLPAGFRYTLLPTGEVSVNLWTATPVPPIGIKPFKDLGFPDIVEIHNQLKEMAQ